MWLDSDVRDNRRCTFSLEEALLWIMDWKWRFRVKNVLMLDLFQLLSSPDVNWWTGVVWIIVMFLSAVWTLILTAPIHYRESIAETVMQRYISQNLIRNKHFDGLRVPLLNDDKSERSGHYVSYESGDSLLTHFLIFSLRSISELLTVEFERRLNQYQFSVYAGRSTDQDGFSADLPREPRVILHLCLC